MKLYGLKTCDTCRKALKSLPQAEFQDIRDAPVPVALLQAALDRFGERLVNTRSTTWRGLSPEDRARAPLDLLAAHPALMKRPLIDLGDGLHLGWDEPVRTALGLT